MFAPTFPKHQNSREIEPCEGGGAGKSHPKQSFLWILYMTVALKGLWFKEVKECPVVLFRKYTDRI